MKVTIFGTGYVGLVQGAVLADAGHDVLCIDVDPRKVEILQNNTIPIYEPGLESLVKENQSIGRLRFSTDAEEGVAHGAFQFIAVGTPPDEDGAADMKHVLMVAETIGRYMEEHRIVVNKSTVPVGTAGRVRERVAQTLVQRGRVDLTFDVVSNPEFLKEGNAVSDCIKPDRIIIGSENPKSTEALRELYEPFSRNHDKIIVMDVRSAELTKYAANCMLATKISFMNEIANLAELFSADIEAVRKGIGSDPRIGYHFIYPGCGYGGSCFPKDVKALIRTADEIGFDSKILKAVEERNNSQKATLFQKLNKHFEGNLTGKTIAIWGLSFKPNTDDMREAPSRTLIEALWLAGAKVQAYDPKAMEETLRIYGERDDLQLATNEYEALEKADAVVICTEWQQFRAPDFIEMTGRLKQPVIIDGRNLYDPARMKLAGFTYYSVGRA